MASGPIGEAFVKITPDVGDFASKAESGTRGGFDSIESLAKSTSDAIASAFESAASAVAAAFDSGSPEAAMQAIDDAAQTAATDVGDAFTAAADASTTALDGVAEGDAFAGIDDAANAAADGLAIAFDGAATEAQASLDSVDTSGLVSAIDDAASSADGLGSAVDAGAGGAQSGIDGLSESFDGAAGAAAGLGAAVGGGGEGIGLGEIAEAAGAALGIEKLAEGFKESAEAAADFARLARITEQLIETTGGAAGVTSEQLLKMAESQAEQTGITKDQIIQADDLLLTFSHVKDAGAGQAAIFDRASQAALDLSTVLGTGVVGSAKLLGKALNDPVNGASALGRVLGKLTQDEKDHIATLVEHGKTVEAQSFILDKVESRFGGASKAAADPLGQFNVALAELKETLGAGILGGLEPLAQAFIGITKALKPSIGLLGQEFGKVLIALVPVINDFAGALIDGLNEIAPQIPVLAAGFVQLLIALEPLLPPLIELTVAIVQALLPFIPSIVEGLTVFANVLSFILIHAKPLIPAIADLLAIGLALLDPFLLLSVVFDKVGHFVANLIEHFGGLKQVGHDITTFFSNLPGTIGGALETAAGAVGRFFQRLPGIVVGALADLRNVLVGAVRAAFGFLVSEGPGIIESLLVFAATLPERIVVGLAQLGIDLVTVFVEAVAAVVGALPGLIESIAGFFRDLPGRVVGFFVRFGPDFGQAIATGFTAAVDALTHGISNMVSGITGFIGNIPHYAGEAAKAMLQFGKDMVGGIADGVSGAAKAVGNAIGDIASTVQKAIKSFINGVIKRLNSALSIHLSAGPFHFDFEPHIPTFAKGGIFSQATAGIFGEAGAEALIPLTDPNRAWQLVQQSGLLGIIQRATSFGQGALASLSGFIPSITGDDGAGAVSVTVGAGAVVIQFGGPVTDEDAFRAGQQVGQGLARALAERSAVVQVRALSPSTR